MSRGAVCVHGHFYQPPRENPWTGEVAQERTAAPYHDWNERITAECYRPNTAARVLDGDGLIAQVVCTYERLSFNVGPTLHAWLARHAPDVDEALREADRAGAARYGRGGALAQPWAHVILPLAAERDRRTLVRWGTADFRYRFGREPEGMWLPETAVDTASLRALAEAGIGFTVLAPHQVAAVSADGGRQWQTVDEATLDTSVAYTVDVGDGRSIAVWCYDGPLSRGVAFERVLDDGGELARRLAEAGKRAGAASPGGLVCVATDGESYGHHHRFGEMALARALLDLEAAGEVAATNLASHLATHPPARQARIAEATSWSCAHGVERWRADCGCHLGGAAGWNQQWRGPLRAALTWLRDALDRDFEVHGGELLDDPWAARDAYGEYVVSGDPALLGALLDEHLRPGARDAVTRVAARRLLEAQRHRLTMETSCGWFFDDAAGHETVLVLRHAARACELSAAVTGTDHEPGLRGRLREMRSNVAAEGDGTEIWDRHVRAAAVSDAAVACALAARHLLAEPPPAEILGRIVARDGVGRAPPEGPADVSGVVELVEQSTGAPTRWQVWAAATGAVLARAGAAPPGGEAPGPGSRGAAGEVRTLDELPADEPARWRESSARHLRGALAAAAAASRAAALATDEHRAHRPVPAWLRAAAAEELAARARAALAGDPVDGSSLLTVLAEATLLGIEPDALDVGRDADAALGRAAARLAAGDTGAVDDLATVARSHLAPRDGDGWWHAQSALARVAPAHPRAGAAAAALGVRLAPRPSR